MVASLRSQILRIVIRCRESNFIFCHFERSEKSQNFSPLPCGGGQRGWVKIRHCEANRRFAKAIQTTRI
ncbi:hypothetical protein ACWIUD_00520 [Helicobacter sp. 23-1044]